MTRVKKLEAALEPFARMARDNPKSRRNKKEPVVGVYIPWELLDDAGRRSRTQAEQPNS